MELNNILLVTRNYRGLCEENFLTTIDEFIQDYSLEDSYGPMYVSALKNVISGAEPYKWAGNYYDSADDSYDMRLCQGREDLLQFLSGAYNDSIEDMEDRNPGTAGMYEGWYWDNRAEFFSERAVNTVIKYANSADYDFRQNLLKIMPDFPMRGREARKPSLDDVLKSIQASREASDNFADRKSRSAPSRIIE